MPSKPISFEVNGSAVTVPNADEKTLLAALRDDLGLWGVKNGCGTGHCGACLVLLNDKPVLSCKTALSKAAGGSVLTVEGLGTPERLHPLQQAFIRYDAVQCGFCTPGMLLAAKALLEQHPAPSEADIRAGLRLNLCRCTGYHSIIRAIQAAASGRTEEYAPAGADSLLRKDAVAKVTGRTAFAADRTRPEMLHAVALHSPYPHARIKGMDIGRAQEAPGVAAVLTARDVPGRNLFGPIKRDQPVFCDQVVRCMSDTVALVVARTEREARAALQLIEVAYEELPRLTSPKQALAPNALPLHADGNILCHLELKRGDVEAALREAAAVVEDTYTTPLIAHAYLEPEACLAEPDGEDGVVIWTSTQNPFSDRLQLAEALGLPPEKVRVVLSAIGGAFGGREDITVQIQAAIAALHTGKPVKMVLTREESLLVSVKRHPSVVHYTSAADKDGRLLGVKVRVLLDTGAYSSVGLVVATRALTHAAGAYHLNNVDVEVTTVFTNNPVAGAMRGFGSPQVIFAAESQMDRLAEALGLDPLEIRLRNAAEVGSTLSTGQVLEQSVGLKETLRAAAQAAGWHGRGKGVGIACCLKNVGLGHGSERDKAAGAVDIHADGRIVVRTGAAEVGQGLLTVLAKIVATELGARFEDITVCYGDTKETPDSGVTSASRQTFMSGNACSLAARQVRAELLALAAPILGVPAGQLECGDSAVCDRADPSRRAAFGAVAATAPEGTISHEVLYRPPETHLMGTRGADGIYRTHATYGYGTQIAFVEVNEETGCVTVKKIVAASDVGRALFPKGIVGQTVGGVVMGLGYALSEEYRVEDGVPKTRTLAGCRVPRAADVPEIEVLIVEDLEPSGPLGAKGTGELPVLPTAPAIANAIYDAIGIRFTELPITRRKVLEALKKKAAAG